MLGDISRLLLWILTIFLVFTNIYVVWEYLFLYQDTFTAELYIPVLCILTLFYVVAVYLVGKEDIDGFLILSNAIITRKSISDNEKIALLPGDDSNDSVRL